MKPIRLLLCLVLVHCTHQLSGAVTPVMKKSSKIFVAGHRGLVGSALMRTLKERGYTNLVTRTSQELDLRDQEAVNMFFTTEQPEFVFLVAAKVGGILANKTNPVAFLQDNLRIQINVLQAACAYNVKKLLFVGSACVYPKQCPQPIKEEYLLTGPLEPAVQWYALAKIAGIKLCQAYNSQYNTQFISCMPNNLYGCGGNFDLSTASVLPALVAKICQAAQNGSDSVEIWGTGRPRKEFLHAHDFADALIFLMHQYTGDQQVNVGTGNDVSIKELATLIADLVGYTGKFVYNTEKPDSGLQRLLDNSTIQQLGWAPKKTLRQGLQETIAWYKQHNLLGSK